MGQTGLLPATIIAVLLVGASVAPAKDPEREPSIANDVEPVVVDEPAFPEPLPHDPVRVWVGSYVAPAADFGGVDLGLVRPELRLRARMPVDDVLSLQLTADFRTSSYDTDGNGTLFPDYVDYPSPDDLYAASLGVQCGYLLSRHWSLFRDDEEWALLGALYGSARWEPGAFDESLTPGLSLGIGYKLAENLRIAVAVRVERALDGDGVEVGPSGYLRWDFAPRLRLSNRGLGLQLEYRPAGRWEIFVTGFRSSDQFRLDGTPGGPSGTTFRDQQVLTGGGVVVKIHHAFRLAAEAGAIVDRQVSVDARDEGRLDSADGDVSPYFMLRAEVRP